MKYIICITLLTLVLINPEILSSPKYFIEGGAGFYKINGHTETVQTSNNRNIAWKDTNSTSYITQSYTSSFDSRWPEYPKFQINIGYGMYISKKLVFKATVKHSKKTFALSLYEGTGYSNTNGDIDTTYENRYDNISSSSKDNSIALNFFTIGINQFFNNQTYFLMDVGLLNIDATYADYADKFCFNVGVGYLTPITKNFSIVSEFSYLYAKTSIVNSSNKVVEQVDLGGVNFAVKLRYNLF